MINLKNKATMHIYPFVKWLFFAALVGVVGGAVGTLFHECLDFVTEVRTENKWLVFFLPIATLVIAFLYLVFKGKDKLNTNGVIEAVQTDRKVPIIMAPLIFVSALISHLFGASVGREGAALQIGGSIGYNVGKIFKLGKTDLHIIVMIGMSALFAALFGTPLTAAVFAIELACVGTIRYAALLPCVISAIIGSQIAAFFGVSPIAFHDISFVPLSIYSIIRVSILALLCALVSIIFCVSISKSKKYMSKLLPNAYLRGFVGGVIIVLLTVILRTYDYNGAGMDVVSLALSGEARPEAFLIKIIFTAICIAAGFKGGEIVPLLFIGSTFGCVAGDILGLSPDFAAAIGFVSVFCGAVNCPLASMFLAIEVFGTDSLLLFALACGISYMMSGNFGIYKSQKIFYSKYMDEEINENVR